MRLGIYTDYAYHRVGERVYAERAFALFIAALAPRFEKTVVAGRLSPAESKARYDLGAVDFVALPFYETLARPWSAMAAMGSSLGRLWRAIGEVDAFLLIGPHLLALPIALMALLRRRRLVLCVRQEYVEYVRNRHPQRRAWHLVARILEGTFRILARVCPVVVVGPRLAEVYGHSRRLLEISISLVDQGDIVPPDRALERPSEDVWRVLSVGRIDREKDPLLLAEILARADERWHLVVCGEGDLEAALVEHLRELGLEHRAELAGYLPHDELRERYRSSRALLHVSRTEGVPQVLFEAFAAGLPVVASDVGGIRGSAGEGALLFRAGDVETAAELLDWAGSDEPTRRRLIEAGNAVVRSHTLRAETERVAAFVGAQSADS